MPALLAAFNLNVLWWILGALVGGVIIFTPIFYIVGSHQVCVKTMRRGGKNGWERGHAAFSDDESVTMYDVGMKWHEENIEYKHDVHIVNNGLNLYGEYYDFGYDKSVMILSGRSENLEYGYYFASPYSSSGFNVLVVDPRAHGLSEGTFNTAGFDESSDALAWCAHIHEKFGVNNIVFHGICIGSAAAMLAITSENCPDYIKGMVAEGMFANFSESVKGHLIEKKAPVFLFNDLITRWMKHYTGHSTKFGPIDVIDKLDKPLLMLHSKEDLYSIPELAQKLYDKAKTDKKKLVWFEHGKHSKLRITDTKKYDESIKEFVAENF